MASLGHARALTTRVGRRFLLRPLLAQGCSGAVAGGGSSSSSSAGIGLEDRDVAFGGLSKSIHRGFKFDRMFKSDELDPESLQELDQMALMSLKTQELPRLISEKIARLLKDFGQKKDLERYGRYLRKKVRSRTAAETPSVLSSCFLPEEENENSGPLSKLRKNPAYRDLFQHTESTSLDDSMIKRLAVAHKEERRHKLFQMFWSPEAALTYAAHRYPATYASNYRVLYELARRVPDFRPRSVLDYGAGPAPSLAVAGEDFRPRSVLDYGAGPAPSLAVAGEVWPGTFQHAIAVEPSEHMSQLGKYLTTDMDLPPIQWRRCLYDSSERHDLIIASYVQMEVRGQQSRDALVKQLWARLTPGGVLVLIEPGTPTGFRFMHHSRELLISKVGPEHFHFVAPCPHEGMCPIAVTGRDWCHFAQRVRRLPHKLYNKGSTKRFLEEEKFSYLVIRKAPGPRWRYASESEAPTPQEKSFFWPRVLFPVIKAGQHSLIDVCSAPQNFERLSISKSKPHSFGYRYSRKAMWGDLWRFPKRVARPEARLYIPEKTREHLDRLAKVAWRALKWETQEPGFEKEQERDKQFYGQ